MSARRLEGLKPMKKQTIAGIKRDWVGFLKGRTIVKLHWDFRRRGTLQRGLIGFTLDDGRVIGVNPGNGVFFTEIP